MASTEDHKPYNDGERARIEKAGGVVSMKRVDGDLAVVSDQERLFCLPRAHDLTAGEGRGWFSSESDAVQGTRLILGRIDT